MAKTILIRPIITEKSNHIQERRNQYAFEVNKDANKIEIRKAVEELYNVAVAKVNTCIAPAKAKSRNTKRGILKGKRASYKKAYISLAPGEVIDIYGAE